MHGTAERQYESDQDRRAWQMIRRSMALLLLAMAAIAWAMARVVGLYLAAEAGEWVPLTSLKGASWGRGAGVGILVCLAASCISALLAAGRCRGRPRSVGVVLFCASSLPLVVWALLFLEFAQGLDLLGVR